MNILFSPGKTDITKHYMNQHLYNTLEGLGHVVYNKENRALTTDELILLIPSIDILITHWAAPKITQIVLNHAKNLKLIAHGAGSVRGLLDECVFQKGIKVISANKIMAKYVSETVLASILTFYQQSFYFANLMRSGKWKDSPKDYIKPKSLFGKKISFIGFGMVGHFLYELLKPFDVSCIIYDPYLIDSTNTLPISDSLDTVLSFGDIVTVHASLTKETIGMLSKEKLELIRKDALFINSARGKIVDEMVLIDLLKNKKFSAILDVFDEEPLPTNSPLRTLSNVLLFPHIAGVSARYEFFEALFMDISRFIEKRPLQLEITQKMWSLMTRWPNTL